jgi:uncharacterized membrane protein
MKKQVMFLMIFVLALSIITTVYAVPPEPMAFYGRVTYTNGSAIPDGYYITAKINDVISGECEIFNGYYAENTDTCIVVTHSTSASKVEFFIGTMKIGESTFQRISVVNLNFNVETLPAKLPPLADGVCKPAECSYNILDCDNSKTKICVGNGVCDSVIGETCENTVGDCGACPVVNPPSGGGGGGSGGKGGSGGGSSGTNVIKLSTNNTSANSSGSDLNESTNDLSGNIDSGSAQESGSNSNIFSMTGLAIGNFVKSPTGKGILIFFILVAVLVVLFVVSKKASSRRNNISQDKIFSNNKSKKRYSKQKNIKVVKLSEMRKRSPQN